MKTITTIAIITALLFSGCASTKTADLDPSWNPELESELDLSLWGWVTKEETREWCREYYERKEVEWERRGW